MTRAELKHRAKRALAGWGWHVERSTATGWQPGRTYWDAAYLRRWGIRPGTLIDVGVGNGTPHLYEAFPDAYLVLVEPLAEFGGAVRETLSRRPGLHFPVAAGAADGELEVRVEPNFPERSSVYARHALEQTGDAAAMRRVPVTTLDRLTNGRALPTPFGLKIDAEGAELDVIRGAAETLRHTDFVIAEVSVLDRFEGGYTFAEFVAAMAAAGFVTRDVLGLGRSDSSAVTFLDLVFMRDGAERRGGA